jgi:hypothetical protein
MSYCDWIIFVKSTKDDDILFQIMPSFNALAIWITIEHHNVPCNQSSGKTLFGIWKKKLWMFGWWNKTFIDQANMEKTSDVFILL